MKKLMSFCALLLIMSVGVISCGNKISPEDEVRNYGKYFLEKLSANQLDSLKASYPDITKADSIVPVQSDTIIVVESVPGNFDMTLAKGITLKVTRSEDGNISVTESKGLFAFPADKMDIAQKTGLTNDSISDKVLADRMKDKDFFEYINKQVEQKKNSILSFSKRLTVTKSPMYMMDSGSGYYTITNNTDKDIKGSDYNMIFKYTYIGYIPGVGTMPSNTSIEKGKDIPAKGSIRITRYFSGHDGIEFKGIKINIPDEEVIAKYVPFTGKEYQEYLNTKK